MIDQSKIFKQAYHVATQNKFLWWFGLALIWTSFPGLAWVSSDDFNKAQNQLSNAATRLSQLPGFGYLLALSIVLALILLVISLRAKAGILISVKAILDKQEISLRKGFKAAKLFWPRILGAWVLIVVFWVIISVILFAPIYYLLEKNLENRAGILAVLALVIYLPLMIGSRLVNFLSPLFIVVFDQTIKESLQKSANLSVEHWRILVWFWFVLSLITGLVSMVLTMVFVAVVGLVVFSATFVYHKMSHEIGITMGIAGGTVSLLGILASFSALITFQETSWLLFFLNLVRPEKIEAEETVPVPEVVS